MSHKAVSWALEQRHLKPGPWIVLIQLADRHNKDTLQCDPDQKLIAADCNMSRATVNRHLDDLEGLALIRRVPRVNPKTNKPLSTFYILGLNFDNPPQVEFAMSQNETRKKRGQNENTEGSHVSNCDTVPCLKIDDSRVSKNGFSESQNETQTIVNKPVREPCADQPRTPDIDFDAFWEEFAEAFPRVIKVASTKKLLRSALSEGVDAVRILSGARAYAATVATQDLSYCAGSESWVKDRRWDEAKAPEAAGGEEAEFVAAWSKIIRETAEGKTPFMRGKIVHATALRCLRAGPEAGVTLQQCRDAGVRITDAEARQAGVKP